MRLRHITYIIIGSFLLFRAVSFFLQGDFSKYLASRKPGVFNQDKYNIIYISITNLRHKHLGTYGYFRKTSPNIDKLAKHSLVFDNAYTHASWTLPAAISLFTSQYPVQHKIFDGRMHADGSMPVLDDGVITLVDVLKSNGYVTAAFTGDRDYIHPYGLIGRFDYSEYYLSPKNKKPEEEEEEYLWAKYGVMSNVIPNAINWLRENKDKGNPFLLYLQGYDIHYPFALPKKIDKFDPDYEGDIDFSRFYWNYEAQEPVIINNKKYYSLKTTSEDDNMQVLFSNRDIEHMIALYDGEIFNADKWIGRLLNYLYANDLLNNTIIIISTEHGEMIGEHGRFMRSGPLKDTFYDPVLHIPLIIYHPMFEHKRIKGIVQLIDIAPTILSFSGIKKPSSFRGKDFTELILNDKNINTFYYAGSEFTPDKNDMVFDKKVLINVIGDNEWKLILQEETGKGGKKSVKKSLFRISEDRDEENNLAQKEPRILTEYERKIGTAPNF
ncbi:MAG: sulfatase [Endomicrobiales bacterium]|nr:sulfatase [Endomicrobiales bacterium]